MSSFGSEFRRVLRLASYDRSDVWLADADDPAGYYMSVIAVHVILLLVDLSDGLDAVELLLFKLQTLSDDLIDISEVSANILQLCFKSFPDFLSGPLLALCQRKIFFPGIDSVHPRLFEVV